MRTLSVAFCLLLCSAGAFGQADSAHRQTANDQPVFIFSPGLSYQKQLLGELGLTYGKIYLTGPCNPGGLTGFRLASEFNFNRNQFIMGPKLGYELLFFVLGTRLNVIDYTDFHHHDFKLTPEVGLTAGYLDIFYGYNYSLTGKRVADVGTHRVTVNLNYNKKIWKGF